MNRTPRAEISDLTRGLRRRVEALRESGFAALGGPNVETASQRAPDAARLPDSAASRSETLVRQTNKAPSAQLPLETEDPSDPARRAFVAPRGEVPRSPVERAKALGAIAERVAGCERCRLCKGRTHAVPGEGSPTARVMFVGEGPGATEDAEGRPFVGRAGQLLTKIIENGMGLRREDVYIANIVKCRPPENRDPEPDEVAACLPYLLKQIEIVDPEVLIPLGRHSMRELAGVSERDTIGRVRGRVYRVAGRAVIPTYHPAYLLRNPPEKVKVWNDIQLAMRELGLPLPTNASPDKKT